MNSKRKCRFCSTYKRTEEMRIVPAGAFCDDTCTLNYAREHGPKVRAKLESKRNKEQTKEFKQNDYRHQFKLTLESAKALCRILDTGKPCISCGTRADIQYAAGHYKSAGAHPELALDLRNLHRQCNRYCNCGLSGNIAGTKTTAGYRKGLESAYGPEFVSWLESHHEPAKRTCEELIELRKTYSAEIRRIERGEAPSRNWRALN